MPKQSKSAGGKIGGENREPEKGGLNVTFSSGSNVQSVSDWTGAKGASSIEQSEKECIFEAPKKINDIGSSGI